MVVFSQYMHDRSVLLIMHIFLCSIFHKHFVNIHIASGSCFVQKGRVVILSYECVQRDVFGKFCNKFNLSRTNSQTQGMQSGISDLWLWDQDFFTR